MEAEKMVNLLKKEMGSCLVLKVCRFNIEIDKYLSCFGVRPDILHNELRIVITKYTLSYPSSYASVLAGAGNMSHS